MSNFSAMGASASPIIGVLDVETTGFIERDLPLGHPKQPKVVQAGCTLFDAAGNDLHRISMIVRPDGWDIPKEASDVHGITTEEALAYGIDARVALPTFCAMVIAAGVQIGHNIPYDIAVVRSHMISIGQAGHPKYLQVASALEKLPTYCTMREGAAITNYPPSDRYGPEFMGKPKPPRLGALYEHLFHEAMPNAHTASGDCDGTKRIFFEMLARGYVRPEALPPVVASALVRHTPIARANFSMSPQLEM